MTIGRGLLEYISQFGTPAGAPAVRIAAAEPLLRAALFAPGEKVARLAEMGVQFFDAVPTWRVLSLAEIYY